MNLRILVQRTLIAACFLAATAGFAAEKNAPDSLVKKTDWLSDAVITVKESYDNNLYYDGVDQGFVPANTRTLKNKSSWVTTVSPKIGLNLISLFGGQKSIQTLSFAYAPDIVRYHDDSVESYTAHRAIATIKGKDGSLSFNLENSFLYVDGSHEGPSYPGGLLNAWSTIFVKDRRHQLQERPKLTLQYDWDKFLIRPTASLVYFDMLTRLEDPGLPGTASGYQNYVDRYDLNGGVDFGYKAWTNFTLLVGYRYGHQYQQQLSFSPYGSSSDYQRALLGVESKPWSWLKIQALAGPDFRIYAPNTPTHITPVDNRYLTTYYAEASLAADLSKRDTLAFKYKQYQFVSCLGKTPYFDSSYDLSYSHKFDHGLSIDLGAKVLGADYTTGNLAACQRNDYDYNFSAVLHYSLNSHAGADLGYSADLGRNQMDNLANASTRSFDRHLVSLSILLKL